MEGFAKEYGELTVAAAAGDGCREGSKDGGELFFGRFEDGGCGGEDDGIQGDVALHFFGEAGFIDEFV